METTGVTCIEHRFETLCNRWIYQELSQLPYTDYQRELTLDVVIEKFGEGVAFVDPADISLLDGAIYLPDLPNSRIVKIEL